MEIVAEKHRNPFCNGMLFLIMAGVATLHVSGCTMTAGQVSSPRAPYEQLLLTQSLFRSLEEVAVPVKPGDSVAVEVAWPSSHGDFSADQLYAEAVLKSWLAQRGAAIGADSPTYRLRVLMQAFGVEKNNAFFGIPAIQSGFWPIALPELTLYSKVRHRGYSRLTMDLYEEKSGRLIALPSAADATVSFERYTLLFVLSWTSTDLMPPPL